MSYYWGIDPGLSGWLAVVDSEAGFVCRDPLSSLYDTWVSIFQLSKTTPPSFVVLEEIPPAFGKFRRGSKASHELPRSVGWIEMALLERDLWCTVEAFTPRRWQALAGCTNGGKERNYARALELFPDSGITRAQADAVLLAWVARKLAEEEDGRLHEERG